MRKLVIGMILGAAVLVAGCGASKAEEAAKTAKSQFAAGEVCAAAHLERPKRATRPHAKRNYGKKNRTGSGRKTRSGRTKKEAAELKQQKPSSDRNRKKRSGKPQLRMNRTRRNPRNKPSRVTSLASLPRSRKGA